MSSYKAFFIAGPAAGRTMALEHGRQHVNIADYEAFAPYRNAGDNEKPLKVKFTTYQAHRIKTGQFDDAFYFMVPADKDLAWGFEELMRSYEKVNKK